ncbi:DUF2993 domain-containing protein [Synechococcus sp. M16CYN]|uniref:LmeA family phospholipid-binding protein n=1 Tax=Synechococcus sp. M16CYN TaxID=3103139 RepID=UPI003252ACC1
MADPFLSLLSRALKLWIHSHCDRLGGLDLTLHGSLITLMRGQIQGVTLTARDVYFQGLPLQHVVINSGPIKANMQVLGFGKPLSLHYPFQMQGEVSISGRALNDALLIEPWCWLGNWLSAQLMGLTTLGKLNIENNLIELQASLTAQHEQANRRFRVDASQGTVRFRPEKADNPSIFLPMDPDIEITKATLQGEELHLKGYANIKP